MGGDFPLVGVLKNLQKSVIQDKIIFSSILGFYPPISWHKFIYWFSSSLQKVLSHRPIKFRCILTETYIGIFPSVLNTIFIQIIENFNLLKFQEFETARTLNIFKKRPNFFWFKFGRFFNIYRVWAVSSSWNFELDFYLEVEMNLIVIQVTVHTYTHQYIRYSSDTGSNFDFNFYSFYEKLKIYVDVGNWL